MSADAPTGAVYLGSSAIVKLVREPETEALLAFLEPRDVRVTSAFARVEVVRAVRHHGRSATTRATAMLDALSQLALDDALLDSAAAIDANQLGSLDAIHLASAQQLEGELDVLVTNDERMLTPARRPRPPSRPPNLAPPPAAATNGNVRRLAALRTPSSLGTLEPWATRRR